MKKRISKMLGVGLTIVMLASLMIVATPVSASPDTLVSTGAIGTNNAAEVVIPAPGGGTLGDITSVSWSEYLLEGYPPHLDILLDMDSSGTWNTGDQVLVIEYAHNTESHYAEAPMPYGAVTDNWYQTFTDDGNGLAEIDDMAFAWLGSGAAGAYPVTVSLPVTIPVGAVFVGGTLAEWKAGSIVTGISESTPVLELHIETDNWVVDTIAIVDNVLVNAGTVVGMTVTTIEAPDIIAISVTPTNITYGTMYPGGVSAVTVVTVTNVGTVTIDADATVSPTSTVFDNLTVGGNAVPATDLITGLASGGEIDVDVQLIIPSGYLPSGLESANLVFEISATAAP